MGFRKLLTLLKFLMIGIICSHCSSTPPVGKTPAESLFLEAKQLIGKKKYIAATEKLNLLKTQHPYSFYAIPAELLLADVAFEQENFAEAATDYQQFRDLHPKYEKIDYVVYRIALSLDNQTPSTYDRDLSSAIDAIKFYQEVVAKYSNSSFVKAAEERIKVLEKKIEDKEKYIADFYFRTENFNAALWRYNYIQEKFSNSDLVKYAKEQAIYCLLKLKKWKKCLAQTKNDANFFDQDQLKRLDKVVDECALNLKNELAEKDNAKGDVHD